MLVSVRWVVFDRVWRRSQGTDMHDHSARSSSKRLAEQLQRLWSTPTKAECQRLSRAAAANEQAEQLDTWEDEGGTIAPRDATRGEP